MKFASLSSGSSGNVQYIEYKDTKILVDAGLSGKSIERLLFSIGVDPWDLDGIFMTHEHMDHAKGAGVLSRRYNLPIIASHMTWTVLRDIVKTIGPNNEVKFAQGESFYFKDLWVSPVPTFHDAIDPNGYVFQSDKKKISILTDTGWVSTSMIQAIQGSDLYYLESNHDEDMLKKGYYPWPLKQRILSTQGHLSNYNCGEVLRDLIMGQGETVILSHLSKDNNTEDLAYDTNLKVIEEMGKCVGKDDEVYMEVAPRDRASRIYNLEER